MSTAILTKTQMLSGVWEGFLTGVAVDIEPVLTVRHLDTLIDGMTVIQHDAGWLVRIPIPSKFIADGIQTFVISDAAGDTLTSFAILAGDVLSHDIRAEVDLLRAELDMLKRAFRRHCVETL